MSFGGWQEEALEFYEGLAADNTKSFWTRHKPVYEEHVLRPMTELLAELAPEFGEPKIFRPYRDVRFSKDKTPYKTHIGALVGSGYIQLSATGLRVGSGMYHLAPDQLDRYRRAVADDIPGGELERIIAGLSQQQLDVSGSDPLKTAPRGYQADHPRIWLLRYKGLIAWKEWPIAAWLGTAAARDRIAGVLTASRPLGAWLTEHVGPSSGQG
ncbi:MAG TPA: DUF2461 domain-containing protein [Streptosporangiaceae bacterium]|nr:DUF2461 domain-containing protein [Streptosporangiaceae bacterium]